jgi:hypothetical protein
MFQISKYKQPSIATVLQRALLYLLMQYARLAIIIFIVGECILLRMYQVSIKCYKYN